MKTKTDNNEFFILVLVSFLVLAIASCAPSTEDLIAEKDIDVLIDALEHRDSRVRNDAARILGNRGDERAVEPLIAALADDSRVVQSSAVEALGELGDSRAVEPLSDILTNHEDIELRTSSTRSLAKIGDMRAVLPMIEVIRDESDDWFVIDVLEILKEMLEKEERIILEKDDHQALYEVLVSMAQPPYTSSTAIWLLGLLADESATELLINAYIQANNESGIETAKQALISIGDENAEELIALVDHSNSRVSGVAVFILGSIDNPAAADGLIKSLDHTNARVRERGARLLGDINDPRVVGALIGALDDQAYSVSEEAAISLGKIGAQEAIGPLIDQIEADRPGELGELEAFLIAKVYVEVLEGLHPDIENLINSKLSTRDTAPIWYPIAIQLGYEETIPALIAAINQFGDELMAHRYMNSGQSELETAGITWATENGYSVKRLPGLSNGSGGGLGWGK